MNNKIKFIVIALVLVLTVVVLSVSNKSKPKPALEQSSPITWSGKVTKILANKSDSKIYFTAGGKEMIAHISADTKLSSQGKTVSQLIDVKNISEVEISGLQAVGTNELQAITVNFK